MRIGLMIGPERGRYGTKVQRLQADARWAEEAGLATVWIPQIPDEFDALTAATLVGDGHQPHRDRHGRGAGPAQAPRRPGPAGPLGADRVRRAALGRARGLPPLDHRRDAGTALRATGGHHARLSRCAGPGPRRSRPVDVENEFFRVHNPLDITEMAPTPVLLAALGPRMLQLCGERTDGTILWMADERAIATHVVPTLTRAAEAAGRPAPRVVAGVPGVPVRLTRRSMPPWTAPTGSWPRRRCRRTTRSCSSTVTPGASATSWWPEARPPSGSACSPSPMPVPPTSPSGWCRSGKGRDELIASSKRTRQLLSSLAASF